MRQFAFMLVALPLMCLSSFLVAAEKSTAPDAAADRIRPYEQDPRYWQYQGERVLLLGGSASARFHRDGGGTGLQPISQASLKAAGKLETLIKLWDVEPSNRLLKNRSENEAYLAAQPGTAYALYFTDGGSVDIDLSAGKGTFQVHWIDVSTGEWGGKRALESGTAVTVAAPGAGGWVAAIVE